MNVISAWDTEDNLIAPNITDITPVALYDSFVWKALEEALSESLTAKSAMDRLTKWNENNSPKVPEKALAKKFVWAVEHYDNVAFPRNLGK